MPRTVDREVAVLNIVTVKRGGRKGLKTTSYAKSLSRRMAVRLIKNLHIKARYPPL